MSPLNAAICTTISYRLMVMHPHTHIPNIIDLSRKTKMLWPGQGNTI